MSKPIERSIQLCIMAYGGCIGFYPGTLFEQIEKIKPTLITFLPDHLKDLSTYLSIEILQSNFFKKLFFDFSLSIAVQCKESNIEIPWFIKYILFEKIKLKLGGRLKTIFITNSYTEPQLLHLMKILLQVPIIQIYGTVETCGIITTTKIDNDNIFNVGSPTICCEIKLRNFIEGSMIVSENQPGEILVKGLNVFIGYYKDSKKTQNNLIDNEWFATGDLGKINKYGCLEIIDTIEDWKKRKNLS